MEMKTFSLIVGMFVRKYNVEEVNVEHHSKRISFFLKFELFELFQNIECLFSL